MAQTPNRGADDPAGSAPSTGFETVELGRTVPILPPNTSPEQALSQSTPPPGGGPAASTAGQSTSASAAGTSSPGARQAVDQVQEQVGQAADQAQQKVGEVVDQAKQTVTSQVASRKDRAAESLMTVAQAIRQTGQDLHGRDQGAIAGYADTAAERVERLSRFLQERDVNQIVGEVEYYARRNPALFLGAAFALGVAAARFLKSSSQSRGESMPGQYGQYGQYRPAGPRIPDRYQPTPYRSTFQTGPGEQYRAASPATETSFAADRLDDARFRLGTGAETGHYPSMGKEDQ